MLIFPESEVTKCTSVDSFEQADIDRMMNHTNFQKRKKPGTKSPFEDFEFYYGKELFEKFGYEPIPSNSVIINPGLLKR